MPILADHVKDVPITVTLKAETLMQIMVIATGTPDIPLDEMTKIKDALTSALNI